MFPFACELYTQFVYFRCGYHGRRPNGCHRTAFCLQPRTSTPIRPSVRLSIPALEHVRGGKSCTVIEQKMYMRADPALVHHHHHHHHHAIKKSNDTKREPPMTMEEL